MATKATTTATLVKILMRRTVEYQDPGKAYPRQLCQGYPAEVDSVAAARYVLNGWAEAEGWAPTAEDERAAAPLAFEDAEAERLTRGLGEADVERVPALARRYRRILTILAASGPQEAA